MKRIALICLCTLAFIGSVFTIEVDQNELRQTENTSIEFISYTGPHTEVDSLQAIADIGESLAGAAQGGRAGDMNRYAVIHAVDPSVKTGLDADIMIIGSGARVDHINNLRVIIAAYLRKAYGYSEKDAKTLAHFVTLYNAVYRGDMDMFTSKYKAIVVNNLTAEKTGLALRYDEWPGKTQIVIPLSDQKYSGTLSTIDTSSISDKNVVNKMREQDDKDIAARKDMIDLKERESNAARDRADVAQKNAAAARKDADSKQTEAAAAKKEADKSKTAAAQSKKDAAAAQKDAETAKKDAAAAKKDAAAAKKDADAAKKDADAAKKQAAQSEKEAAAAQKQAQKNPNDQKAAEEAAKKQQEAAKKKQEASNKDKTAAEKANAAKKGDQDAAVKQKEADAKQKEADTKQKEADAKQKEADTKQNEAGAKQQEADESAKKAQDKEQEAASETQFADTKEQEAQSDRKDVAADTRKIIEDQRAERKAQDDAVFASSLPGAVLKVVDSKSMLSEVVLLDLKTEKPLKTSSLNTIRGRSLIDGGDVLIAIAGSKSGNQMITLIGMNPRTLEMTKQATVPVAEQSLLVQVDDSYYAVIEQSGKNYLARFNDNLEMQAKSAVTVLPYTPIRSTEKGLLVQDTANNIRLLNADTLAEAVK